MKRGFRARGRNSNAHPLLRAAAATSSIVQAPFIRRKTELNCSIDTAADDDKSNRAVGIDQKN
jgi:hypothetical protein